MFRVATSQNTRRAHRINGTLSPLAIPSKGMNARDTLAVMPPQFAIVLTNVVVEAYGLRTRKGYSEWAKNLPTASEVSTVMSYYPATAAPAVLAQIPPAIPIMQRMMTTPRMPKTPPPGKLFAATAGQIFDVTAGGVGPWVAQVGVGGASNFWTWCNFQNVAGSFLLACCDTGGYAIYNGAAWTMPVAGTGVGQIDGVNPALFVHVMVFKKRLWFIEKNTTRAWYLPVGQITGKVTAFDFGEQFGHGGNLSELEAWTVDGGIGIDDHLVAISAQGDVVIYKGVDPNVATDFNLVGNWYVGALPAGKRAAVNTGGDIHILSQYGVTPLSVLLSAKEAGQLEQSRISYLIAPLVARLMRDYATLPGWSIRMVPKEELMLIRIPLGAQEFSGQFLALKVGTGAWSVLKDLPYVDFVNIGASTFAGTPDGRVLRAFDGPLDNVQITQTTGSPIHCIVTPAYQPLGNPGLQKVVKLVRPTFVTTITPKLTVQPMFDYGPPRPVVVPTLPDIKESFWDDDKWDEGQWSGLQDPISEWLGTHGVGFAATVQFDYRTGGDTLLASIDFWTEQGGVM